MKSGMRVSTLDFSIVESSCCSLSLPAEIIIMIAPVKNHGIPQHIIPQTLQASKEFFRLPQETKSAIDIHKSSNFKGYTALLGENTNPENRGDLHEGFDIGWEALDGSSRTDDGAMTGENVWPEGLPGFRETVLEY